MAEHLITPPPGLVEQWKNLPEYTDGRRKMIMVTLSRERLLAIAAQAAQYGADQELEACEKYWMTHGISPQGVVAMRYARRPQPPSLKETLLARVARIPGEGSDAAYLRHWVDNESQRLVDLLHEVFKSLPD